MRIRPPLAGLLVAAVMAGGCAPEPPGPAPDARRGAAVEFAVSARRALEGTRFDSLSDAGVADLVLGVCDAVEGSSPVEASLRAIVADVEAPAGDPVDDEIMAVVLAEGALAVCPGAMASADRRSWESAAAEEQFLGVVSVRVPVTDGAVTEAELLEAGWTVCRVLDREGTVEDAVTAVMDLLFGPAEPGPGEPGEREWMLAGSVLAAAASTLCPGHLEAVVSFVEELAGQD